MEDDRINGTLPSFGYPNEKAVRRDNSHDKPSVWRGPFVRDTDKILHCPFYQRYTDKTQVYPAIKNDDITRRGLHVQLVSRIARTIGAALNLNLDLIESISLGHDIGHTPFGHAGEKYLDNLFNEKVGRRFSHNVHSVRVLDRIFPYNVTLQTLSGIASHDGEREQRVFSPAFDLSFEKFDELIEKSYVSKECASSFLPQTLEACVVRISDIISYLGKDRQDAQKARRSLPGKFESSVIGTINAEIINNLVVNIIENSYGKPAISMDEEHFDALVKAKKENYSQIYFDPALTKKLDETIKPMMEQLYDKLLSDLKNGIKNSPVFLHHVSEMNEVRYARPRPYMEENPHQIVVDYIASMTDDYFLDVYGYLFPKSNYKLTFADYFS